MKTRADGFCFPLASTKMSKLTYVYCLYLLAREEMTYLFLQYLSAIWNVINFEEAEVRFKEAV